LTLRGRTRRLQYVTGHSREDTPADLDWKSLADPATTTAVYMPRRALAELIDAALAHGLAPETPAIAIASATRPDQRSVRAEVRDLVAQIEQANLEGPLLVLLNASGGAAQPATRLNTGVNAIG
jgi:uroporphyrin-III C-methyltransferase/precorrin-2 dehydrogenase/sirohydrochlorin ferrochelatase